MKHKYQLAVVIGRWQPFHNLHKKLVEYALGQADKVIIILGSHKSAPDIKNPFTSQMRELQIDSCFTATERKRLIFRPLRDHFYDENAWLAEVQNIVRVEQEQILDDRGVEVDDVSYRSKVLDVKVALVGHFKDETSYYLKMFPQWTFESMYAETKESNILNATDIRKLWFEGEDFSQFVPPEITTSLRAFTNTEEFKDLKKEYVFNKQYKADTRFVNAPYDPIFVTTDAVVTAMGHILLVRRGFNPGKGLLACPGGFLQPELTLENNVLKELREETKIKINSDILRSKITEQHVFDFPFRSLRGRTVTHAFHIELTPNMDDGLPIVKGGDDADKAFWLPISAVADYEDKFFEDHFDIIKYFVRV